MKPRDEFANVRRRRQRHARRCWALDASHESAPGVPDGIRVDKKGNLYGAGPGGVWIISPEGKHLGTINVPETVSNVAWGDKDGKRLYITASTSVYRIKLRVPGVNP
jgi:gluconolactonase